MSEKMISGVVVFQQFDRRGSALGGTNVMSHLLQQLRQDDAKGSLVLNQKNPEKIG